MRYGRLAGIARGSEVTEIAFDNLGLPATVGGVELSWDLAGAWPVVSRIGEVAYERDAESLVAVGPDGSRAAVALDWAGSAGEVLDPWGLSAGSGVRLGYRGELCIGHLVWLGLKDPAPGDVEDLRQRFGLHPLAAQEACKEHERPKLNEYDDDLFVVLNRGWSRTLDDPRFEPSFDRGSAKLQYTFRF